MERFDLGGVDLAADVLLRNPAGGEGSSVSSTEVASYLGNASRGPRDYRIERSWNEKIRLLKRVLKGILPLLGSLW